MNALVVDMVTVDTPEPFRLGTIELLELFNVLDHIPAREPTLFLERLSSRSRDLVCLHVLPNIFEGHRVCGVPRHVLELCFRVLDMVLEGRIVVTDRRNVDACDT